MILNRKTASFPSISMTRSAQWIATWLELPIEGLEKSSSPPCVGRIFHWWKWIKPMQFYRCRKFSFQNQLFKNIGKNTCKWWCWNLQMIIWMYFFTRFWTTDFEIRIFDIYKTALVWLIFNQTICCSEIHKSKFSSGFEWVNEELSFILQIHVLIVFLTFFCQNQYVVQKFLNPSFPADLNG